MTAKRTKPAKPKSRQQPAEPKPPDDPHGILARMHKLGFDTGIAAYLAKKTGIDYQRIAPLFRKTEKGRIPATRALKPVLDVLDAMEQAQRGGAPANPATPANRAPVEGNAVIYLTTVNDKGEAILTRETHSIVRSPEWLGAIKGVFGVAVRTGVMSPVIRPGDRLILNPAGIPQPGSRIMLIDDDGVFRIREYVDETETVWIVKRYGNEPKQAQIAKSDTPQVLTIAAIFPGR